MYSNESQFEEKWSDVFNWSHSAANNDVYNMIQLMFNITTINKNTKCKYYNNFYLQSCSVSFFELELFYTCKYIPTLL